MIKTLSAVSVVLLVSGSAFAATDLATYCKSKPTSKLCSTALAKLVLSQGSTASKKNLKRLQKEMKKEIAAEQASSTHETQ